MSLVLILSTYKPEVLKILLFQVRMKHSTSKSAMRLYRNKKAGNQSIYWL